MARSKFLDILSRFRKLVATFVVLIGFFSYYNIFLIDATLENLKFSLEQTAMAYDIEDTNGIDMILSQATAEEVAPAKMNAFDIGNLEFAKGLIDTGTNFNQLDYLKVALSTVIKSKEKERGIILTMLGRINRPIRKGVIYLAYLPRQFFRPRLAQAQTGEAAILKLSGKLRAIEKEENLSDAAVKYAELVKEYAETDKISLIKLRLAYTYHRLGEYDKALELYREIAKTYYPNQDAKIAQIFISGLKHKDTLLNDANLLIIKSAAIPDDNIDAKQDTYYQIGLVYTKLFNLEEARRFFRRTIRLNPVSDMAAKAQFNLAWILKQENKLTESIEEFSKIAKEKPTSELVLNTSVQLADVLHSEGKYEEAAKLQLKMAEEYKDSEEVAALALFQAGATYMYDLNDTKKAKEIFSKLTKLYPKSTYGQYLAPEKSAIGMFLTYVLPRTTRVLAWRVAGLYALSGLSGELVKAETVFEEPGMNLSVNDWCAEEFPDSIGDIFFDVRGIDIKLEKGNITISGKITFGKYAVKAEVEGHLEVTKDGGAKVVITKAYLNKIPILPMLINNTLTKTILLINNFFPLVFTNISIEDGKMAIEAYGSKRIIEEIKSSTKNRLAGETTIEEIKDPKEQARIYGLFKEKFPASDFSPKPTYSQEELFQDFFTRMYLYAGFKLMETVKDSKLDYARSIRTLGRLMLVESKFRVNYTQDHINADIARFVSNEFPRVMNERFLFDVIGLKLHFKDSGEIGFQSHIGLGYNETFPMEPKRVYVEGTMVLEIDLESKLPRLVFKEVSLDNKPYDVEKLNLVTLDGFNLLKDAHIPFKLDEIKVYEGGIVLQGKAPRDYTERLFSDPYLFVIFHVRDWDLGMAGIERLRSPLATEYEDYRGTSWEKGGYGHGQIYQSEYTLK